MLNARQVWGLVLDDLQLRLPRSDYETWLHGTAIVDFQDGLAVISTPNSFAKQWLERKAGDLIRKTLASVLGYTVQTRVVVADTRRSKAPEQGPAPRRQPAAENVTPAVRTAAAKKTSPAKDPQIAPRDKRKIGAFWVQDCILDDYAPVLGPVGLAALLFFYMMANADTRECWFSQRHLALHLGVHRSHDLAPALDLLRKLQLVKDTGRRTTSGAYIWVLLNPVPLVQALLLLLAAEDEERVHPQPGPEGASCAPQPPRTVAEKVARIQGLYPASWRPVRKKAQFRSVAAVLAAVEEELREGPGATLPAAAASDRSALPSPEQGAPVEEEGEE